MTNVTVTAQSHPVAAQPGPNVQSTEWFLTLARLAWRNLWRNRRRSWLTIGGIAFAVWFLIFSRSMQGGTFDLMIDNTARVMTGHLQIQQADYADDPRVDHAFDAAAVRAVLEERSGIRHVSARAQGYALASVGERSFGAQVVGVEADVEQHWSAIAAAIEQGRYLQGPGEVVVGSLLARNLGLEMGDELLLLGTASEGGIAAHAATLVGIFATASSELNRSLVQIPVTDFREAWSLAPGQAHALIAIADGVDVAEEAARDLKRLLVGPAAAASGATSDPLNVLNWRELMPEAEQMRDMKVIGTDVFFIVLTIIIGFSVVNTFMMMVFERTKEFGLLMAVGMRPRHLHLQLQIEALYLSVLGLLLGLGIATVIIWVVHDTGIPIPMDQAAELLSKFNMSDRVYPRFDWVAVQISTVLMLLGVQLAALVPSLRLYRMRPVDAMRQET